MPSWLGFAGMEVFPKLLFTMNFHLLIAQKGLSRMIFWISFISDDPKSFNRNIRTGVSVNRRYVNFSSFLREYRGIKQNNHKDDITICIWCTTDWFASIITNPNRGDGGHGWAGSGEESWIIRRFLLMNSFVLLETFKWTYSWFEDDYAWN